MRDDGKPTKRYELCHTGKQRKLLRAADKYLAKAGYFTRIEHGDEPVDPNAISINGNLRPTWQGRP